MLNEIWELIVSFFSHEYVRAGATTASVIFLTVGTKMIIGNTNKQKGLFATLASVASNVISVKKTSDEGKEKIELILNKEKLLEQKMELIEKKENFLADMVKALVKGTSIDIEDKLDVAEAYDKFKELDIKGLTDTFKDDVNSTKDEIISQVKQHKQDTLTKLNAYKQALTGTGDDNGKDDSKTDNA